MFNHPKYAQQGSPPDLHSPYEYGGNPRLPSSSGATAISSQQSYPAHSSSQLDNSDPYGSNRTGAPLNRALLSSPSPAQTQPQRYQETHSRRDYPVNRSHKIPPPMPEHGHELPKHFQRTPTNRDSNTFPNHQPYQAQSQRYQGTHSRRDYPVNTSHKIPPPIPEHGHVQLPQHFQRTPTNRDPNAFPNLQPYETQSPQFAGSTSTQNFQQHSTSDATCQDVYIAVMGITGSGKSTFVGICSRQNAPIGHCLESSQLIHLPHSELAH